MRKTFIKLALSKYLFHSLLILLFWSVSEFSSSSIMYAQQADSICFYWEASVSDSYMISFYVSNRDYISPNDAFYITMGVQPIPDSKIAQLQNWVQNLRQSFPHNKIIASTSGFLNLDSLGAKISRNTYLDTNITCLSYDYEPTFEPEFTWNLDTTLMVLDSAKQIAQKYNKQLMTLIIVRSLLSSWNPSGTDYNPTGELWNYYNVSQKVDICGLQTQGYAHYGLTNSGSLSLYGEALDTLLYQFNNRDIDKMVVQLTFGTTANGITAQQGYDAVNLTYAKGIKKINLWYMNGGTTNGSTIMQQFFYMIGKRSSNASNTPSMQETIFPQYMGVNKTNERAGSVFRIQLHGLLSSTQYDMKAAAFWSPNTYYGNYSLFDGDSGSTIQTNVTNAGIYTNNAFTTDAFGNKDLWVVLYPDAQSNFNPASPGQLSVTFEPSGTTNSITLVSVDSIKFLDLSGTLPASESGALLVGGAKTSQAGGKFVFAWDNTSGTGRPLSGYIGEVNQIAETNYPADYDTSSGKYGFVIPTNNPNGVRRLELFYGNGTSFANDQSSTGFTGTVNPVDTVVTLSAFTQAIHELIFPQYMGNYITYEAVGTAFRIQLQGLTPSTQYDMKAAAFWAPSSYFGNYCAYDGDNGNPIQPTVTGAGVFTSNAFTTDAFGSKNLWIVLFPINKKSNYSPTTPGHLAITVEQTGTTSFTRIISADSINFLDLSGTLPASQSGALLVGTAAAVSNVQGRFIFGWDNINGTGRPLSGYLGESNGITEIGYPAGYNGGAGNYGFVIPSNNPNGVQRLESFNGDGTSFANNQSQAGYRGTVNPTDTLITISSTDVPLDSIIDNAKDKNSVAAVFKLGQNYPNPFNPSTVINYSLPKNGFASLTVYNILGQKVAVLFYGFQNAGSYKADFDASKLASGIYLYRLQSNGFTQTKKMLLMK